MVEALENQMHEKVQIAEISNLNATKIDKSDLINYLPDYMSETNIKASVSNQIEEYMKKFANDYEHIRISVDARISKIRQDFDMPTLRR